MIPAILKDFRVLFFVLIIVASVGIIGFSGGSHGIYVNSIETSSPFYGKVSVGEKLESLNDMPVTGQDTVSKFQNFTGALRVLHNGKIDILGVEKPGLDITVLEKTQGRIHWGMDIVGGTRILLKPKEKVSDETLANLVSILDKRINTYGLKEARVQPIQEFSGDKYVQVEMAGGSRKDIEDILSKQGKFEGKVTKPVSFSNGTAKLLGKDVTFSSGTVFVDGKALAVNDSITVDNIGIELVNFTNSSALFYASIYTGADIKYVCIQEQSGVCYSRVQPFPAGGFEFTFQVFVTNEGAQKFAKATADAQKIGGSLDSRLVLFLDGGEVSILNIDSGLAGVALTQPQITGVRPDVESANAEKLSLQTILQSGALPVPLEIVKVDQVSAKLGEGFLSSAIIAALVGAVAVGLILFIRYRDFKVVLPALFTSLAEVVIIFAVSILINWTIDLPALAGIMATIGTGVDAQIMIIDELKRGNKEMLTFKQKIKKAFFMIWGSGSTVLAAMIPLMVVGIGGVRGFAITTMFGVLIGIIIARPAFGKIAEYIVEGEKPQETSVKQ
ncbi:MAG: hypothetical protein HY362_01320 [Candidatus Aenigmarchaeota archaeon]|nr:hypothetical protein [Candidatus Aenigmarchaeota archaeon]